MKLLTNMYKKHAAAALVKQGLRDERQASREAITDSLELFCGSLGDSWDEVSPEAAAGMVLVALAKNSSLAHYVNACGWRLVLAFVGDQPDLVRYVSPRAMADIGTYRAAGIGGLGAQAA
jgi:hypothetical protein